MYLDYKKNKPLIESFYHRKGFKDEFVTENNYLENAFNEINEIWLTNFYKIEKVKYLMIAEAPLWGQKKSYIYNPDTINTQFFYRSDLETILGIQIKNKKEFINICNNIGLLILDISPFPFNTKDTKINYSNNKNGSIRLSKKEYKNLVVQTIPYFIDRKIKLIKQKQSPKVKAFFRYERVKNAFIEPISKVLIENGIISSNEEIRQISQRGGGIDRTKLNTIINDL